MNMCNAQVVQEVKEVVRFPSIDHTAKRPTANSGQIISHEAILELHAFVTRIAESYQDNPFHNLYVYSVPSYFYLLWLRVTVLMLRTLQWYDKATILAFAHIPTY